MFGRSVLFYVNALLGLALAAVLGLLYWYLYRPLPQQGGTLRAPISAEAKLVRDGRGIPHIQAASREDALFLQGYATAQDRLWQMDALRRLAAGELSEIVGKAALNSDREARMLRLRRLADSYVATLPSDDLRAFAAYARGVNEFISTHRTALPPEFTILRYDPRPWTIADSLLTGLQMYRELTTSWGDEVRKADLLRAGDAAKVNFLFPTRLGAEPQVGSNAWVIAGRLTASGKPLLANDPHLGWGLPSTWHLVHLEAPGFHVEGATLPGLPGVVVGHNERIAWGVTNLQADVQDTYRERIDLNTGQVLYRGQVEQARLERETIRVKGEAPFEFTNWITRHGPLLAAVGHPDLALQWTAGQALTFPFLRLDAAQNWHEFLSALRPFTGPGQNFVYADVDGNIGYHATGAIPVRASGRGDVPTDGSTGETEWQGYLPFDQLPQLFNPPSGLIATANQNPFPSDSPVNGNFAAPFRVQQIRALLSSGKRFAPADMITIQKDVYSAYNHFLVRQALAAYDRTAQKEPALAPVVALLRSWDGQMEYKLAAPYVATLLDQNLRRAAGDAAAPGKGGQYEYSLASAAVTRLLRERPAGWFASYDALLVGALSDAADEARRGQGRNLQKWSYGRWLSLTITNPVLSRLPWVGHTFDIGPVLMSGSGTTVKQTSRRLGPSMRFVADLNDWDQSLQNLTIGESGQYLSAHYRDQWLDYYYGRGERMPFRRIERQHTVTVVPK